MTSGIEVFQAARGVLLDFDGPVCSVFSHHPARTVAQHILRGLRDGGHSLPGHNHSDDPLEILRAAADLSLDAGEIANSILSANEQVAVQSAQPTHGTLSFLEAARRLGLPIAIVSNNSESAIRKYLEIHGLVSFIDYISARTLANIHAMKPAPSLLANALREVDLTPGEAVMVGDSQTDMIAAQNIGAMMIGLANKPGKRAIFTAMPSVAVIDTMDELAQLLNAARNR